MGQDCRVLHVDDEPAFSEVTAEYLERETDWLHIETAISVDEGFDILDQTEIDCIVSDYDMPRTDGIEFLEQVRAEHPDLPFILFTGKGTEEIASRAISAGVTDYLQKEGGSDQFTVLANKIENAVGKYRMEQELEMTRRQYQKVAEQNLAGIYLIQDGEFTYVNPKLADIHGYDRETIIGMSPLELVAPEERDRVQKNLQRRLSGEVEDVQYETVGLTKDGDYIDIELHGSRIIYDGNPAVIGAELDITERKEQERRLSETAQRLQAVLDTVEAAIFIKDTEGRYQLMNQECRNLLGIDSEEEIIGRTDYDFLPEETAAKFQRDDQRVIEQEETIEFEEEIPAPDRRQTNLTLKSPFYDDEGELQGICAVSTDISELKRQREKIQRQNERFEEVASTMSHDLQTPLSTALIWAESAVETGDTEEMQKALEALERTDKLRNDLVDVLRTQEIVGETESVDIEQIARAVWDTTTGQGEASLKVRDTGQVDADSDALRRLFENFFSNALEHGSEEVTIWIGTTDSGFFVEDDGPGIPEPEHDDVFSHGYSTKQSGNGVGLASVREIVKAHDWNIQIAEGPDGGVRFDITGVSVCDE